MTHFSLFAKPLHTLLMTAVLAAVFMLSPTFIVPTWAANSFKVGLVDPQAVIEQSRSGKRALETLKEHATVRQKLLANDEQELKDMEQELRNSTSLSEAEKQAKQEDFRKKVQEYQKRGQDFQQELSQKQREMVLEYMHKIEAATKVVAEKHGFSMVLDKGSDSTLRIVLYNQNGLDITSEVVKEFDRRYK